MNIRCLISLEIRERNLTIMKYNFTVIKWRKHLTITMITKDGLLMGILCLADGSKWI
jgi:hypothetical protein